MLNSIEVLTPQQVIGVARKMFGDNLVTIFVSELDMLNGVYDKSIGWALTLIKEDLPKGVAVYEASLQYAPSHAGCFITFANEDRSCIVVPFLAGNVKSALVYMREDDGRVIKSIVDDDTDWRDDLNITELVDYYSVLHNLFQPVGVSDPALDTIIISDCEAMVVFRNSRMMIKIDRNAWVTMEYRK